MNIMWLIERLNICNMDCEHDLKIKEVYLIGKAERKRLICPFTLLRELRLHSKGHPCSW